MDLRVLSYFLAVAREESFSKAAAAIHISQPTLSRQIADLEAELGKKLFVRGARSLVLTEEGQLLKKRAQELLSLAEKTETEIRGDMHEVSGNIYIGAGETYGIHTITQAFRKMQETYPDIYLHISSGDSRDLSYQLENGLIDLTDIPEKTIAGMSNGVYKLSEINAPPGYVILTGDIYFKVSDGAVTLTDENGETKEYSDVVLLDDNTTIAVKNTPGAALPHTGGTGTGLIYLLGILLTGLSCAGFMLFKRKKRAGDGA